MNDVMVLDDCQSTVWNRFPSDNILGDEKRYRAFLAWMTFFRRNLHRCAEDYFQIPLYPYQEIMLYELGVSESVVVDACRAAAKSFIIALYGCCMSVLYPGISIVACSATKGQSKLMIRKKIQQELMRMSPVLQREIKNIRENNTDAYVEFQNGSVFQIVAASDNARGNRANIVIYEEARQINKFIIDSVISPFLVPRKAQYEMNPYYDGKVKPVEPQEIYISSSWYYDHWFSQYSLQVGRQMINGDTSSCLMAFDLSLPLRHGIKTVKSIQRDQKKFDPTTFDIEYRNTMPRENMGAYFTRSMLISQQRLQRAAYPKEIGAKKNKYAIPKQDGEIRVLAIDIAAAEGTENDNTIMTCLRAFKQKSDESNSIGYHITVPYIEHKQGGDAVKQCIRMKQIFYSFDADYVVMDLKSIGIPFYDILARVMYDPENDCEYPPWKCFNFLDVANRIDSPGAQEIVYGIRGSSQLNSDMATNLRMLFINKEIELLLGMNDAVEFLQDKYPDYSDDSNPDAQVFYESPYLETALLIDEMSKLKYEKLANTGLIRLSELAGKRKDRYSSLTMGCYFISLLAIDEFGDNDEIDLSEYRHGNCYSHLNL